MTKKATSSPMRSAKVTNQPCPPPCAWAFFFAMAAVRDLRRLPLEFAGETPPTLCFRGTSSDESPRVSLEDALARRRRSGRHQFCFPVVAMLFGQIGEQHFAHQR